MPPKGEKISNLDAFSSIENALFEANLLLQYNLWFGQSLNIGKNRDGLKL